MLTLLTLAVLGADATPPMKVATTGWTFSGIDAAVGDAFLDRFATQLASAGDIKVTTPRDINQVLGLERQKQLMGCGESTSSCLAELAGALGVDAVISCSLVKVGSGFTVTLRALDAQKGGELAASTERLKTEDAVQDWLDGQARQMASLLRGKLRPGTPVEPVVTAASSRGGVRLLPLTPGIVGVAALIASGICFGVSRSAAASLAPGAGSFNDSTSIHETRLLGHSTETASAILLVGGGVLIAASVVWWLLDSPAPPVSVEPTPGGAKVSFGGRF